MLDVIMEFERPLMFHGQHLVLVVTPPRGTLRYPALEVRKGHGQIAN